MRVALYARVSTKDKGQDPETQLIPLRDFAKAKQYEVVGEFVDKGWSGSKERRPELDRLMRAAKRNTFDAVLVWRFDRFARSTTHLLSALATFHELRIDFISFNEAIDTSTPIGKMVFTVLAAVAEMERALIRERVLAGIDRARRQGKKLGRHTVLVDKEKLIETLSRGASISQTAREFGISRPTVRQIAKSAGFSKDGEKAESRGGNNCVAD